MPTNLSELLGSHIAILRRILPESIAIDFIPGHKLATMGVERSPRERRAT